MKKLLTIIFVLLLFTSANAADYYFSTTGSDSAAGTDSDHPWQTFTKLNAIIAAKDPATQYNIYFKRGDIWTLTGSSGSYPLIVINKSYVTFDAYGTGNKPKIKGNAVGNQQPAGLGGPPRYIPYGYVITIGETSTADISNVYIKNLWFYDLYPGSGIIFKGKTTTPTARWFVGPGSVEYCDFEKIGWTAIALQGVRTETSAGSGVPNPANAIKIEHNNIYNTSIYASTKTMATGWPQAITGNSMGSMGHECRYNKVWDQYSEGIGAQGFSIVEYNMIWSGHAASIYTSASSSGYYTDKTTRVIRYNLCWADSDSTYPQSYGQSHIRLDDEGEYGINTNAFWEIYGNICIGGFEGISLRNHPILPEGTTVYSVFGGVKVYNNTIIDCKNNFVFSYPQRLGTVIIKNNASILNEDVDDPTGTAYNHYVIWESSGIGLSNFEVGPNFWYGDGKLSNANLQTEFRHDDNVFGTPTVAPLPLTNGRVLSSLDSFSFTDLYPSTTSQLIDAAADLGDDYDQYVTTGTDWEALPTSTFVMVDQDNEGTGWDFGAVIRQTETGGDAQEPYNDDPWAIPGVLVMAEYDLGGEGFAYHDTTTGNNGGILRTDNVDIWHSGVEGNYVGAFATTEYLEFTVDTDATQEYQFNVRTATSLADRKIQIYEDGNIAGSEITLTNTGSYSVFATVSAMIPLTTGSHVIRVYAVAGGFNISTIDIRTPAADVVPVPTDFVILKDNSAANSTSTTTTVHLDWTASAGATSYTVYGGQLMGDYIYSATTTDTDVVLTGVDANYPLFLTIRAFIDDRPSAYATEIETVWIAQTITGSAISNFRGRQAVEKGGNHTITITPTSTNYGVTARRINGEAWTATTTPTYTFTAPTTNQTIDWIVQRKATQSKIK